ncbi:TPA: glycosyltransferase [Klebsiella pneumoniae]|nr:glycosyltransferase [Klebsiella pneumoniae]
MEKKIKFSVLLSLYNKESPIFLSESLQSVINQTVAPDQIVIVYDGFISESLKAVVNSLETDIPLDIIQLAENVGLGRALNEGLKYCKYSYVARMDTDDICHKRRFEYQIKFLQNNPNVTLLGTSVHEFDDDGRREKKLPITHNDICKFARTKNPFNHMSVMFKKDDILKVGGYRHHLYMEDYNLWLRIIKNGFITANLAESLLDVRIGNGMLGKRRGIKYIKSELQLFKLKKQLKVETGFRLYMISFLRIFARIVPEKILILAYKIDRGVKE